MRRARTSSRPPTARSCWVGSAKHGTQDARSHGRIRRHGGLRHSHARWRCVWRCRCGVRWWMEAGGGALHRWAPRGPRARSGCAGSPGFGGLRVRSAPFTASSKATPEVCRGPYRISGTCWGATCRPLRGKRRAAAGCSGPGSPFWMTATPEVGCWRMGCSLRMRAVWWCAGGRCPCSGMQRPRKALNSGWLRRTWSAEPCGRRVSRG